MSKLRLFTLLLLFASILACGPAPTSNENTEPQTSRVSLRQEWFPFSGYAGEVFAAKETAREYGLEIDLQAGSDQIDPLKLVINGESNFGVASADKILQANEKGASLVIIGVVNHISPTCYITKENSGITTPQEFVGRRVGILTGTNTEMIYRVLKRKTGLEGKEIREIEIPFDLATFVAGQYDVRPAFIYDEPVSLDLQGIKYNVIKPADYGINFIGTVYFTTRSYYDANPQVVERFVNALAEGWTRALKDPEKAVDYLKLYDPTINPTRELLSLRKGLDYFRGENNQVMFASQARWEEMASQLREIGSISSFNYTNTIRSEFVSKFHER